MTDLPAEIQVWRSTDTLDHTGTWSTTRYPAEAVTYVRSDWVESTLYQHGEVARKNFLHLMSVEAERNRIAAQVKALREGLGSIAKNTCCEGCQEAAYVARAALEAAALAAMQPHERQNYLSVMGQRAVVKRIAEKQIKEGE